MRTLATEPENLDPIPGTHIVGRRRSSSCKLSSDLTCTLCHVHIQNLISQYNNLKKKLMNLGIRLLFREKMLYHHGPPIRRMSCAGDRPVFYQDTVHNPLPSTACNPPGDEWQVGKQDSEEQNYCRFLQCSAPALSEPSEMLSPVWPQARLPAPFRVLGDTKGDWGQHSCALL